MTWSTQCAAVSLMCLPEQEGQKDLLLHANATSLSKPQAEPCTRTKPMIVSYCASRGSLLLVGQNILLCVPQVAAFTSIFQYCRVPTFTRTAGSLPRFTK